MTKLVLGLFISVFSLSSFAESFNFDVPTSKMYAAYVSYKNGVVAMSNEEESCWQHVKNNIELTKTCGVLGMAGVLIEKTYARHQGRSVAPNYNDAVFADRLEKRMKDANFSAEQVSDTALFVVNNMPSVIAGLANAGMH